MWIYLEKYDKQKNKNKESTLSEYRRVEICPLNYY